MGKVTVVGSYIVAFVMDVDHTPLEGETLTGRNYHITHGGKGSNMAVAAARLGGQTTFLGRIGRDACGEDFLRLLAKENVDAGGVLFSDKFPTAVGFILTCANGTNSIVVDPAACVELCPADLDEHRALIDAADVVGSPGVNPL